MTRRWEAGMRLRLPNAPDMRVETGSKCPGDLRLDWFSSAKRIWLPVNMSAAAVLVDFFSENEDHLYPPPRYMGGRFFMEYLVLAQREGWQVADQKLRTEQRFAS